HFGRRAPDAKRRARARRRRDSRLPEERQIRIRRADDAIQIERGSQLERGRGVLGGSGRQGKFIPAIAAAVRGLKPEVVALGTFHWGAVACARSSRWIATFN